MTESTPEYHVPVLVPGRYREAVEAYVADLKEMDQFPWREAVFGKVDGPVITSSDVADCCACTTEAARQKPQQLSDQEHIDQRKTGGTTSYWMTSD